MSNPLNKIIALSCVVGLATLLSMNCASTPDARTESEADIKTEIHAEPKIMMKPYHHSMSEEMKISFERADEIIIGVYTGARMDKQNGKIFYFDNFMRFNKKNLRWGPVENVLLPVLSFKFKPKIITREEFKYLSNLDKVGICWDYLEQKRYVYLVEGKLSLVFIEQIVDEENNSSYRNLLDTYPVTKDCNAKVVFDLMVKDKDKAIEKIPGKWYIL
jgi:hypothetical protein